MAAVRAAIPDLQFHEVDPGEADRVRQELELIRRESQQTAVDLEQSRSRLQAATAETASLRIQASNRFRLLASVTAERDRLAKEVEALRLLKQRIGARTGDTDAARQLADQLTAENQSLRDRIKTQADEWMEAFAKWEEATCEMGKAQALAETLTAELEAERARQARGVVAEAPDVADVLRALLPNLHITDESLGYLFRGLEDRGPVLKLLALINTDTNLIRHKTRSLNQADGWADCHFSTGRSDDGRLYFSRPVSGRRFVLLAPKESPKAQERLIRRLCGILSRAEHHCGRE